MNLPNKLTLSRLFMIPFFVVFLMAEDFGMGEGVAFAGRLAAFLTFIVASITDWLDGAIARKHNLVTNFGRLMDPLADKLLVAAAFVSLVEENIAPAWMVIIILSREFLITGLRLVGTSQGRVIQADRLGKNKTITQIVAVLAALAYLTLDAGMQLTNSGEPRQWLYWIVYGLLLAATLITLWSGWMYYWKNRDLLGDA